MTDAPGLGLRYFACDRCETVFALPDAPTECGRCAATPVRELRDVRGPDPYFAP